MALQQAAVTAPTGVTITGVLIHSKRTREEDVALEPMDNDGTWGGDGKSIRKKTTHTTSGQCLTTAVLPTVGSGTAEADTPKIDSVEIGDEHEDARSFTIEDHYHADGEGDYA